MSVTFCDKYKEDESLSSQSSEEEFSTFDPKPKVIGNEAAELQEVAEVSNDDSETTPYTSDPLSFVEAITKGKKNPNIKTNIKRNNPEATETSQYSVAQESSPNPTEFIKIIENEIQDEYIHIVSVCSERS